MSIFRRRKEEQTDDSGLPQLVSWDRSATKQFDCNGLEHLRNAHPDELASEIWKPGRRPQGQIIDELIEHGNLQKAALVLRQAISDQPLLRGMLVTQLNSELVDFLLESDIRTLPTSPDDFRNFRERRLHNQV